LLDLLVSAGEKVDSQVVIGNCVVDIVIPRRNLVIEVDGKIHATAVGRQRDSRRDMWIRWLGMEVFRVPNQFLVSKKSREALVELVGTFPKSMKLEKRFKVGLKKAEVGTKKSKWKGGVSKKN